MHDAPLEQRDVQRDVQRPTLGHIRALDGIRAVAVTAVVLYHAGVPGIRGGFLGVEVFFVLSGFLITSLLVTELGQHDSLRFARFYERRARRLLPALVVLIGIVTVFAYVASPHGSYPSLPGQILGTMAYVGNWTLIANHATYFSLGLPPSPLQHTWSLAIEEQFYLVWPAALYGLWRITTRRATLAACCVAGALAAAAATGARYGGEASVNSLYFATQTHATTMLMGAALALLILNPSARPSSGTFRVATARLGPACNTVGVAAWAGVIALLLTVSGTGATLYRGGFLVVGAVVAVAIGATVLVPGGWSARALSLGPLVFVGQVSYGIYLFHFPIFLWIDHTRTGLSAAALLGLRLAVTLAVAVVSYELVERPIRERRLIRGWSGLVASAGAFCAAAVLAYAVASSAATVSFADSIARWDPVPAAPQGTTTRVLLVGDSMAQTLGNGLNNPLARKAHVYVEVLADPQCSVVATEMRTKDFRFGVGQRCTASVSDGLFARWKSVLGSVRPSLSMVLFRLDIVDHRLAGQWVHVGEPGYDCALRSRLVGAAATLAGTGRPVILLTTPYYSTGEQPNGSIWSEDEPARVRAYNAILRSVAAQFPGVVRIVDLSSMVSPEGRYTRTIGNTDVRWIDGVHFTYAGDSYVLPRLLGPVLAVSRSAPSARAVERLEGAARMSSPASCRHG